MNQRCPKRDEKNTQESYHLLGSFEKQDPKRKKEKNPLKGDERTGIKPSNWVA